MSCCAARDSISSKRCRCSLLLRRRSRLSRASCRKSGNSLFLGCSCNCTSLFCAPVAQLDRAFGFEPKGREVESLRAHHIFVILLFDTWSSLGFSFTWRELLAIVFAIVPRLPQRAKSYIFKRLQPTQCAPVAQLDRAFGYEPKGRRFESFRAHHTTAKNSDL